MSIFERERSARTRNDMPEFKPYVYRGTGRDQMPFLGDEALAPYRGGYEQWVPSMPRGGARPGRREIQPSDWCRRCGYKHDSQGHRIVCGES